RPPPVPAFASLERGGSMTSTAVTLEVRRPRMADVDDSADLARAFRGKRVFITGGLGFFRSTVARRLLGFGAEVALIDSLNPLYGGNRFNLDGVGERIETVVGDARDIAAIRPHLREADCIFHLAAQVSYIDSLSMPLEDLQVNAGLT